MAAEGEARLAKVTKRERARLTAVLAPRQLEVYLLHKEEGLGTRAIAERLGLGRTHVKDTLAMAKMRLRQAGLE